MDVQAASAGTGGDGIAARRAAIRARALAAAGGGEDGVARDGSGAVEGVGDAGTIAHGGSEPGLASESESEEYETESSEEGGETTRRILLKPVFVPRVGRDTIAERAAREAEEEEQDRARAAREEGRRAETREMVAARLAEEAAAEEAAAAGPVGAEDIVTDDELQEEEDYQEWRGREFARLVREKESAEKAAREAEERERWRAMSEGERAAWLASNPKPEQDRPKKKWKFLQVNGSAWGGERRREWGGRCQSAREGPSLHDGRVRARPPLTPPLRPRNNAQKYWHRGAFFQTEGDAQADGSALAGDVLARDFSGATGEDRFDKSALPQVMQVSAMVGPGCCDAIGQGGGMATDKGRLGWESGTGVVRSHRGWGAARACA